MGLSIWQLKRQIAYLAALAAWADTPQGLVYSGGAFVSEDLDGNFRLGSSLIDGPLAKGGSNNAAGLAPYCRVQHVRTEWDRGSNSSRIERALLRAWSTAGGGAVPGTPSQAGFDSHGINQVTGANRADPDGSGQSQGRDVDELIGRFCEEYSGFFNDSEHAFQGRFSVADGMRKVNGSAVLKRGIDFEVFNALQSNYYHPATSLSAAQVNASHVFFLNSNNVSAGNRFRVTTDSTDYDFIAGTDFIIGASAQSSASNLKDAINLADIGVSASQSFQFVTVTRTTGIGLTISCTGTGNSASNNNGSVGITVVLPPSRFDTLTGVLRRGTVAGEPAPTLPSDGTDVPIALATFTTEPYPGAGTWNYSYFMGYAETDLAVTANTPDRYSSRITTSVDL